jgi:hypothetical protein
MALLARAALASCAGSSCLLWQNQSRVVGTPRETARFRSGVLDPATHVHLTVHPDRRIQMRGGLLTPVLARAKLAEAEVAVRDQRTPENIRLAEATRHPYTVAVAYHAEETLHLIKGDWARARILIERQIAVLRGPSPAD